MFEQPPAIDITGLYPYAWAAGAIVSTDEDVARFFRALLSGRVIGPRLLEKMQQGRLEHQVDFPGQRYGLGLISFPSAAARPGATTATSPATSRTRSRRATAAARWC